MPIQASADGRHHPATTAELSELIVQAHANRAQVRVIGAGLSTPRSVHVDGNDGTTPPSPGHVEIVLDRMCGVTFEHEDPAGEHAVVAVEAGCLLGRAYDDLEGTTWPETLTYKLTQKGYALAQLAGVSHQRVAGMMMTGSSGGSVTHAWLDHVLRFELVDGTGVVHDLRRDDPDAAKRERFFASGVSMGLCGVISRVWLRVQKRYDVVGSELTIATSKAAIDLEGPGDGTRPSLAAYLRSVDYARVLWWPQHDFNRLQIWQAQRVPHHEGFVPVPYVLMSKLESMLGSLLVTILGNLDDLSVVPQRLEGWHKELERYLDGDTDRVACPGPRPRQSISRAAVLDQLQKRLRRAIEKHPGFNPGDDERDDDFRALRSEHGAQPGLDWSDGVAWLMMRAIEAVLEGRSGKAIGRVLKRLLPGFIDEMLGVFLRDGEKHFRDSWMCGLPMDNQMEEPLWRTDFTELWIPLDKAQQAVRAMSDYFAANGDVSEAYSRTGPFTVELYAGPASDFWMSPGYGTPCLRVNVFWFHKWAGSPRDSRYPALWALLKPFGFRTHWGKHLPGPSDEWRQYLRTHQARLSDFLAVRDALDPRQLFVTSYWREHLGIGPALA